MASPLDEVLEAFAALLETHREPQVETKRGEGNFRCDNCEDCSLCRFCTDCTACEDCTYCEGCRGCNGCTHCKECHGCRDTTHSRWTTDFSDSSYLLMCLGCEGCVQCFACVGLEGAEFCVLNEKLPRKAYFSRVAAMRGALEERIAGGWRPPWSTEPDPEEEAVPDDAAVADAAADEQTPERVEAEAEQQRPAEAEPERHASEGDDPRPDALPPPAPAGTRPWTFADVDRNRDRARAPTPATGSPDSSWPDAHDDAVPEPPPYGSDPGLRPPGGSPGEGPGRGPAESRARDRYGWSEQAEGTPERMGWSALDEPLPARQERDPRADDLVRRRRETAATPHADQDDANERFAAPEDDLVEPELDPLLADRGLEPWPLPDEPPRSSLGPDEQTEPDAPVSRRGSARHGLSGAAVPLSGSPPPERSEEIAVAWVEPLHPREGTDGGRESSLGRARRPERPRSPESRDRGTGLLRGRAPTRPQTPAPQPDAPSLRRARRPGRGVQRDETPTAPFPAADSGPFEASDS